MSHRKHRHACPARGHRAPEPGTGRAVRPHRRRPAATPNPRLRQQHRHHSRRVPSSVGDGCCGPRRGRGRVRARRHVDPQHRKQPGIRHRGTAVRTHLDPAQPRPARDRRVRRSLAAQFTRNPVRHHGFRSRARHLRGLPHRPHPVELRSVAALGRRRARAAVRFRRGPRRTRPGTHARHHRDGARSGRAPSPRSESRSQACATAGRSSSSVPPGTAPPPNCRRCSPPWGERKPQGRPSSRAAALYGSVFPSATAAARSSSSGSERSCDRARDRIWDRARAARRSPLSAR